MKDSNSPVSPEPTGWITIDETKGSDDFTERMKVPGGWIVRTFVGSCDHENPGVAMAMVFIPRSGKGWT